MKLIVLKSSLLIKKPEGEFYKLIPSIPKPLFLNKKSLTNINALIGFIMHPNGFGKFPDGFFIKPFGRIHKPAGTAVLSTVFIIKPFGFIIDTAVFIINPIGLKAEPVVFI